MRRWEKLKRLRMHVLLARRALVVAYRRTQPSPCSPHEDMALDLFLLASARVYGRLWEGEGDRGGETLRWTLARVVPRT